MHGPEKNSYSTNLVGSLAHHYRHLIGCTNSYTVKLTISHTPGLVTHGTLGMLEMMDTVGYINVFFTEESSRAPSGVSVAPRYK